MKLTSNYLRFALNIIPWLMVAVLLGDYLNYLSKGMWWSIDYWLSLSIPLTLFPIAVCLMFVPQYIIADEDKLTVKQFFREPRILTYDEIKAFGHGHGVFMIQPINGSTLQIHSGGFSQKEWKDFNALLETKCKGKMEKMWFGPSSIGD